MVIFKRFLLLLLLSGYATSLRAAESHLSLLYQQVHQSVVTVQSWENLLMVQNHINILPVTEQGSGVLISPEGEVLTAAHLVQTADVVQVEFIDGTVVYAQVVGSEPTADVALLKLAHVPEGISSVKLGDSDRTAVGERIAIIGAPYGLSHTLTVGYLSARHAPGSLEGNLILGEFLQTDAAINRGNSGGPMFNMQGEVIGIVSYILSRSGGFEGVGFAVSSNSARTLLFEQRSFWTGITVFGLNGVFSRVFNLPQETGVLVQRIAKDSPGARIGLRAGMLPAQIGNYQFLVGGDIILSVDDIPVGTAEDYERLRRHIDTLEKAQPIAVEILRHGQVITLSAPLWE